MVAASTAVRYAAGRRIDGLWIMPDEAIYANLGRSLYEHGRLAILGASAPVYGVVYPALVGLPLSLGDLERGYRTLKAVQALVMSLAAVPVFLWARSLMRPGWALLAAALTLAAPVLVYSGLVMTEVAFYPVSVLVAWAAARALATASTRDQLLACAAIALAVGTRLQAFVYVPALVTAILLKALLDRRPGRLALFAPTGLALGSGVLVWLAWRLAGGGPWRDALGGYADAGAQHYAAGEVARFAGYHAGDLVLMVGVVPVCAAGLLAVDAVRGRESSEAVRAYLAVTLSFIAWVVLEVGAFAAANAGRILERDLSSLAPLAFIGLALWLARGADRPLPATPLVALAALVPVLVVPFGRLTGPEALPDAFGLAPLVKLASDHPSVDVRLVAVAAAAVLAAAFVLVPRRLVIALPGAVLLWLAGASALAGSQVVDRVRSDQRQRVGAPNVRWIDRAASGEVTYVYTGEPYWTGVWQEAFWNGRLRHVLDLPGARVPGPIPQSPVRPAPDGRLELPGGTPARAGYAVAVAETTFVGDRIAELPQVDAATRGLALWRVEPPVRLSTVRTGVLPNGDMAEPGRLVVYDCRRGRLLLTLLPKASRTVELVLDGSAVRTLRFHGEDSWSGTVPVPASARARVCTFEVRPDSLLGSTVFEFERR